MLKRLIPILLAVMMLISCTGCGSDSKAESEERDSAPNSVSAAKNADVKAIIRYDRDGNEEKKTEYEYNGSHRVSKETIYEDGDMTSYITYDYDDAKHTTTATYCNDDGSVKKYKKEEYDADDNIIKLTYYKADGSYDYEIKYTYEFDNDGSILSKIEDTCDGYLFKETYRYDIDGNKSQTRFYTMYSEELRSDKNLAGKEFGVWIEASYYSEYQYDDQGKLIREKEIVNGQVTYTWEYDYDTNGNILTQRYCRSDATLIGRTEYIY